MAFKNAHRSNSGLYSPRHKTNYNYGYNDNFIKYDNSKEFLSSNKNKNHSSKIPIYIKRRCSRHLQRKHQNSAHLVYSSSTCDSVSSNCSTYSENNVSSTSSHDLNKKHSLFKRGKKKQVFLNPNIESYCGLPKFRPQIFSKKPVKSIMRKNSNYDPGREVRAIVWDIPNTEEEYLATTNPVICSNYSLANTKELLLFDRLVADERAPNEDLSLDIPSLENSSVDEPAETPINQLSFVNWAFSWFKIKMSTLLRIQENEIPDNIILTTYLKPLFDEIGDKCLTLSSILDLKRLLGDLPPENFYVLEWLITTEKINQDNYETFANLLYISPNVLGIIVHNKEYFFDINLDLST